MSAVLAQNSVARRHVSAGLIYCAFVALFAIITMWLLLDIVDRADELSHREAVLAQFEDHAQPSRAAPGQELAAPGSPFLEGQTVTVAGAALQQRVDAAVRKAGGSVLSSQIDLDGPQSKDGFVKLTANLDIAQPGFQQLLYDLEAGMPFLFVDTLVIQAPQATGEQESARLRIVIGVYGQWLPLR